MPLSFITRVARVARPTKSFRRLTAHASIVLLGLACGSVSFGTDEPQAGAMDTLLVLKNGAEVRGLFVSFKDGKYTIRLPDGRSMSYEGVEVERMERLANTGPVANAASSVPAQPAEAPVVSACETFLSEKEIDRAFYTTVREIAVYHGWYGSGVQLYGELAKKAHSIGADAVINVHTWHSPKGFSWAAPHAGGIAIKWTPAGRAALPGLEGHCY